MNTFKTDLSGTGARLSAIAVSASRNWGHAGARRAVPAAYRPSVDGNASAKLSALKCVGMALIDTTGWPLGPQERLSG